MNGVLLFLTCANQREARVISTALLKERLIVCAKTVPVASTFRWKGKIEEAKEVLLLMETVEEKFSKIEREVRRLHSYEQFVLLSVPIGGASKGVTRWIEGELQ